MIDLERAALLGRLLATVSPPSDYEFGSYLTVSTKHLKADDAELLANHAGEPGSAVMVAATGYGWIVSLGCEEDEGDAEGALRDAGFSDGFVKLRRVLRGYRGGRYRRVEFDRDAPVQSDLQTYQWDRTVKQIPYERVVPTYAAKSA
ncbi:hypothetical protein JN531_017240 (plasmid) [Flagellatimonas centrodinii]|uniref:DUF5983 family protein n=1 Tax=Flagellatimonas centrodinii TaxID=2806210 RepID=UPI001FF01D4E|nr:hypothetical protein [Flagellatimonas centrodinii]ULQ48378.1 hypothetical protein JN531_017240 [Flagellatimonas centrodinii]